MRLKGPRSTRASCLARFSDKTKIPAGCSFFSQAADVLGEALTEQPRYLSQFIHPVQGYDVIYNDNEKFDSHRTFPKIDLSLDMKHFFSNAFVSKQFLQRNLIW